MKSDSCLLGFSVLLLSYISAEGWAFLDLHVYAHFCSLLESSLSSATRGLSISSSTTGDLYTGSTFSSFLWANYAQLRIIIRMVGAGIVVVKHLFSLNLILFPSIVWHSNYTSSRGIYLRYFRMAMKRRVSVTHHKYYVEIHSPALHINFGYQYYFFGSSYCVSLESISFPVLSKRLSEAVRYSDILASFSFDIFAE